MELHLAFNLKLQWSMLWTMQIEEKCGHTESHPCQTPNAGVKVYLCCRLSSSCSFFCSAFHCFVAFSSFSLSVFSCFSSSLEPQTTQINSCCYRCNNVVGSDYSFIRLLHLEVVFCFLTEHSQAVRHSLSTWQQLFKCHFLLLQLARAFPQLRNLLPFISERSPGDHCLCCHGKRQTLSECGLDFLIQ